MASATLHRPSATAGETDAEIVGAKDFWDDARRTSLSRRLQNRASVTRPTLDSMPTFAASTRKPLILVGGPPCSGKGTQCKRLARSTGLAHVSVGDLVREKAKDTTSTLGETLRGYMSRGDLVPDDLMLQVVKDKLAEASIASKKGVVLDGFPRTRAQAEAILANMEVDVFVVLQVGHDSLRSRAKGRLQDPTTGAIYHESFMPPPRGHSSSKRWSYREGDRDEIAMARRIHVYDSSITEITPLFKEKLHFVNGEMGPDDVFDCVRKIVTEVPGVQVSTAALDVDEEDDWSDEEKDGDLAEQSGPAIQISIAPCTDVDQAGGDHTVAVSISVPDPENIYAPEQDKTVLQRILGNVVESQREIVGRVASDVCCVIDISGSMNTEATYEDENENVKSDGLSYLDIVKHAVKTVIHMLGDADRLSLVAFDDRAEVAFAADFMTADGRKRATEALEDLRPRGRTNIWAGLKAALDDLRTCENVGGLTRPKTVLLLTDGCPNEVPPRGHIAELRDYKEAHPGLGFMINTFGFGYQLDSQLLLDLAVEGHGTYGFIPDALIVGTSFVNSVANVLSTLTQNAVVHLSAAGGAQFKGPVMGTNEQMITETSWGRVINLGPLQLGATRELVLPMHIPSGDQPYLEATLVYKGADGRERQASGKGSTREVSDFAACALARGDTIDVGYEAVKLSVDRKQQDAQENMASLVKRLESPTSAPWVPTLQGDVAGRVSKSLLGEARFNRWGKHYLRAFARAHQIQYCTNFMDKSLQDYGGALFKALREEGDKVFISLPPPTPSKKQVQSTRRMSAPAPAQQPDMTVYYGGSGGG